MTWSSFPQAVLLDTNVSKCCGPWKVGFRAGGGRVLGRTSLTIHWRERTLTSWSCSGGLAMAAATRASSAECFGRRID
jgi:hypothetical protein